MYQDKNIKIDPDVASIGNKSSKLGSDDIYYNNEAKPDKLETNEDK